MTASQTGDLQTEHKFTNRLIHETSPYLLQHAHNPVDWYPWGEEAWNKAKEENKLVIVSIGYSACHWCHVMERESFEDEAVAKLMNESYICIKVDREERPDVDQLFMDAVQIMTGRGGWPLNAFALPDGRPVYAGTYFPKTSWTGLLHEIGNGYKFRTKQYLEYAEKLVNGIRGLNLISAPKEDKELTEDVLKQTFVSFMQHFDSVHGGNGRAPKFPMPDNYNFLLRYYYTSGDKQALEHVKLTLDKMAKGGIYDQVGGGFARYSTDAEWKVPHFEKMLYDNAQLLCLYSEAYQLTKSPLYKKVVYQTIEWLKREMSSKEGAFYSALDADSEGEEGKFYVWKKEEIEEVLGDEAAFFIQYYGIGKSGYWEHGNNILVAAEEIEKLAPKYAYTPEQAFEKLARTEQILLKEREKRTRPGLDDKILTSWNALTIKGLLDAYKVFKEKDFFDLAEKNLEFLQKNAKPDGHLYHTIKTGKASIPGFLEDYCFYIQALLHFYQATFQEEYLQEAKELLELTLQEFYDEKSGYFFFTSSQNNELVSRKIELADNVIASPNSAMAQNLFMLGKLFEQKEYTSKARRMLSGMLENITTYGPYYANWAVLMLYFREDFYELAITGKDAIEKRLEIENYFIPNKIVLGCVEKENCTLPLLEGKYKEGRTIIYPCIEGSCGLPEENAQNAIKQMLAKGAFFLESAKTSGSGTSL